jgi:heme oxygenase
VSGLASVREATRRSHERLEAAFVARPWDATCHQQWLERLLGVHLPLEAALDRLWLMRALPVHWPSRRRVHLIRADLVAMGRTPAQVAAVRTCRTVPLPATATQAWGALYLLDGATLGGAVIGRAAIAAGVPADACRSLHGQPGAPARWRETSRAIDALSGTSAQECARWAAAAFEAVGRWLAASAPPAASGHHGDEGPR